MDMEHTYVSVGTLASIKWRRFSNASDEYPHLNDDKGHFTRNSVRRMSLSLLQEQNPPVSIRTWRISMLIYCVCHCDTQIYMYLWHGVTSI